MNKAVPVRPVPPRQRLEDGAVPVRLGVARWSLVAACRLFAGGVAFQVFCVGMVLLAGQGAWLEVHRSAGSALGLLVFLALASAFAARLPRRLLAAAAGLFLLYGLQFAFVGAPGGSFVRAFHAVNAVALFWLATYLGRKVSELARGRDVPL